MTDIKEFTGILVLMCDCLCEKHNCVFTGKVIWQFYGNLPVLLCESGYCHLIPVMSRCAAKLMK